MVSRGLQGNIGALDYLNFCHNYPRHHALQVAFWLAASMKTPWEESTTVAALAFPRVVFVFAVLSFIAFSLVVLCLY